jgi:hypothetical protein
VLKIGINPIRMLAIISNYEAPKSQIFNRIAQKWRNWLGREVAEKS